MLEMSYDYHSWKNDLLENARRAVSCLIAVSHPEKYHGKIFKNRQSCESTSRHGRQTVASNSHPGRLGRLTMPTDPPMHSMSSVM